MPAHWIRTPGPVHVPNLQQHYSHAADAFSGFMFGVDEKNHAVILDTDAARQKYAKAQAGVRAGTMIDHGVQTTGASSGMRG